MVDITETRVDREFRALTTAHAQLFLDEAAHTHTMHTHDAHTHTHTMLTNEA